MSLGCRENVVDMEGGTHALNTLWEKLEGRDHLENADV
jgi:hypothetical protein